VYWPAFLMAAGVALPKQIVAHGWLLFEAEKMSKSKGNIAYAEPIVKALDELTGAKVGNDALRYYLLRETVFGQDGNFSRDALLTRYNADLANGLGNLASRVLTMIHNYCGGAIPNVSMQGFAGLYDHSFVFSPLIIRAAYDAWGFGGAILSTWGLIALADDYLSRERPWAITGDPSRRNEILYKVAEALRIVTILSHPVVPDATQRIWEQLGQPGRLPDVRIDQLQLGGLKPGTKIGKPEAVYPRVDKKEAWERIEAMEQEIRTPGAPAAGPAAAKAEAPLVTSATVAEAAKITIEDFAKIDLRVGVVKSAEKVAGADRLLKLLVDIGSDEVRQVLAGIAPAYAPDQLLGRKVVVVTNLAPRKMRGLESNGMILAASAGPDGQPVLCTFSEEIAPGAKVK